MVTNIAIILIFITLTSVTAQTFQYSRGWTNGKRDGNQGGGDFKDEIESIGKVLSPCLIKKLKYLLEGKPFNERLFTPCHDYPDDDIDNQVKRFKNNQSQETIYDAFQ